MIRCAWMHYIPAKHACVCVSMCANDCCYEHATYIFVRIWIPFVNITSCVTLTWCWLKLEHHRPLPHPQGKYPPKKFTILEPCPKWNANHMPWRRLVSALTKIDGIWLRSPGWGWFLMFWWFARTRGFRLMVLLVWFGSQFTENNSRCSFGVVFAIEKTSHLMIFVSRVHCSSQ